MHRGIFTLIGVTRALGASSRQAAEHVQPDQPVSRLRPVEVEILAAVDDVVTKSSTFNALTRSDRHS